MTQERDTQFLGFARLLFRELTGVDDTFEYPVPERLIAQRAYDLAYHVLEHTLETVEHKEPLFQPVKYYMPDIPDLTSWPITVELPDSE